MAHSYELSRPIKQTAPHAMQQPSRSIPQFSSIITQFSSRGRALSHSSLAPSYIPPHSSSAPLPHGLHPQLPSPPCSTIPNLTVHIPVLTLAYLYLQVVRGCSSVPCTAINLVKITKFHGTVGKLMIKLNIIAVSHDLSIF